MNFKDDLNFAFFIVILFITFLAVVGYLLIKDSPYKEFKEREMQIRECVMKKYSGEEDTLELLKLKGYCREFYWVEE